jgi:hypothetical protein
MSQVKAFEFTSELLPKLIEKLETWLLGENFRVQTLKTEEGNSLIQIEKRGGWRKVVGMSTALNIVFQPVENILNVEIGAGRWLDKAAAGAISMVILWPLLVTAGIGAFQQMGMPDKIYGRIEYLLRILVEESKVEKKNNENEEEVIEIQSESNDVDD